MISGCLEKFGFWSKKLITNWKSKKNWIWIHAVSVGEINAIIPLAKKLNATKSPIMISTTTEAGYNHLKKLSQENSFIFFYFPFDLPWIIKNLLRHASIKLLIITETEIWPNLLTLTSKKKIPVILVNARLSEKSFKNYMKFKFFFRPIINNFEKVLSQSQEDSERFLKLGLDKNKLFTTGNIKFSTQIEPNEKTESIKEKTTIMFASTHREEEKIAIHVFKRILSSNQNLNLIIAPRHIDRTNEIIKIIKKSGFIPILKTDDISPKNKKEILILNTIGELKKLYKSSDITILGGTFVKIGGHNLIEPISAGSYTIIGPHDFKIKDLKSLFKAQDAIVQVNNINELEYRLNEAINNPLIRKNRIENGIKVIKQNQNVLEETIKHLNPYL